MVGEGTPTSTAGRGGREASAGFFYSKLNWQAETAGGCGLGHLAGSSDASLEGLHSDLPVQPGGFISCCYIGDFESKAHIVFAHSQERNDNLAFVHGLPKVAREKALVTAGRPLARFLGYAATLTSFSKKLPSSLEGQRMPRFERQR